MILWRDQIIMNQLHSLCIDNPQMIRLHHCLHEMLVDESTKGSPLVAIMHHKQVVSFGDKVVRDERWWSVAVNCAFLIDRFLDKSTVCDNCHGTVADFEGIESAILFGPLCEPEIDRVRMDSLQ